MRQIGKGLENLRNLYGSKGYANFVAIPKPQIDEARHIIWLVIDVDEGRPVSFGDLRLEGIEPVAGAGKSLLASWKNMQGKQFNPEGLKTWLASEMSDWAHEAVAQVHTGNIAGSPPDVAIDVLLHFQ
jgi:outer membrane protein assembly factor BamA